MQTIPTSSSHQIECVVGGFVSVGGGLVVDCVAGSGIGCVCVGVFELPDIYLFLFFFLIFFYYYYYHY